MEIKAKGKTIKELKEDFNKKIKEIEKHTFKMRFNPIGQELALIYKDKFKYAKNIKELMPKILSFFEDEEMSEKDILNDKIKKLNILLSFNKNDIEFIGNYINDLYIGDSKIFLWDGFSKIKELLNTRENLIEVKKWIDCLKAIKNNTLSNYILCDSPVRCGVFWGN